MDEPLTRPWTVTLGCALSVAICAWDIVDIAADPELLESVGWLALILTLPVLPLIFTTAAFLRRKWGRIVMAVIAALGVVCVPVLMLLETGGPVDGETVLYAVVDVGAVVLLYLPLSNAWYRQPRVKTA